MARQVRIALILLGAGFPIAAAFLNARPGGADDAVQPSAPRDGPTSEAPDMRHCRTDQHPDAACKAGWEARRRHFFGADERR